MRKTRFWQRKNKRNRDIIWNIIKKKKHRSKKEQLIYEYYFMIGIISQILVAESKCHRSSMKAINDIREAICKYNPYW